MKNPSVTKATLGRLPMYLQYINGCEESEYISASVIAEKLSLGEVMVRKDLSSICDKGRPKLGFKRLDLIESINSVLCTNKKTRAVLVGVGKLGSAILDYNGFSSYGIEIVCGFDASKDKIGSKINQKEIYDCKNLKSFCEKEKILIGIITVPKESAQKTCDEMVSAGIKAIWNFAPVDLEAPEGVEIKRENLALSLAYLNQNLH